MLESKQTLPTVIKSMSISISCYITEKNPSDRAFKEPFPDHFDHSSVNIPRYDLLSTIFCGEKSSLQNLDGNFCNFKWIMNDIRVKVLHKIILPKASLRTLQKECVISLENLLL